MPSRSTAAKTRNPNHLSLFKFLAWKSSDVTSAVAFLIVSSYLTMFCSDFLGMDPAVVGVILLASNIIDFFTDFIGAYIVDNTDTKWGRGRPYELGIVGMGVCTILLFATPAGWSNGVKIAWIFFMYTFEFGVFNTLRAAAQNVYCIRAFRHNRAVMNKVSSFGGIVTTLGSMVVSVGFPVLMGTMATSAEGWLKLVGTFMVPFTLIGLLRFIFVKEHPDPEDKKHEKTNLKLLFSMLKRNHYGWYYAGMLMVFNVVANLGVTSYYWKYIVGDLSMMGVLSVFSIVLLPVMFFCPLLMKKFTAPQIISAGSAMAVVGYLLIFFAKTNVGLIIVGSVLTSFANLFISYLGFLIIVDLATYNRYLSLPSMEASIGAIFNGFGTQLGQGIGGAAAGFLLSAAGYISTTADTVVQQPESALLMIRLLYSLIPMAMMLVVGFCAMRLHKLAKQIPTIEAEVAARNAKEQSES